MSSRRTRLAAAAIVLIPLLGYPALTLAEGAPHFPSRNDCVLRPQPDRPVAVVYGRFDKADAASALLTRVLAVGFKGTELRFDACGRWVVLYEHVPTSTVGSEIVKEANRVGLHPTLELDPSS